MAGTNRIDRVVDVCGLLCPRPMFVARKALKEMGEGELLEVVCNDNSTRETIPRLCREVGGTLIETRREQGLLHFIIKK
ncbi:MAG: sulfurtransferase TusA family protein [Desulfobacterales bacterium]|nr:sulfurtransferase TusA family protein [Desulfobacterales bacterium]